MAKHKETNGDQALNEQPNALFSDPELAAMFRGMEEVTVGFPPYFVIEVGKGFRGIPMLLDNRDPDFPRYHIKSLMDTLDCQTGPIDNGEIITVEKGQIFTIGAYAALPLESFFGFEVGVFCRAMDEMKRTEADFAEKRIRNMYRFRVMLTPEDKKLLKSQRDEDMKFLREKHAEMRRLAYKNMIENYSVPRNQASVSV